MERDSWHPLRICLHFKNMYGTGIADHVRRLTNDRVKLGPGTLYLLLAGSPFELTIKLFPYYNNINSLFKSLFYDEEMYHD